MNDERLRSLLSATPEHLDRAELLALVVDLQQVAEVQQQTLDEQRSLMVRSGSDAAGGSSSSGADRTGPPAGHGDFGQGASDTKTRTAIPAVAGMHYTLVFDGGSRGNPGLGYGSYQIVDQSGTLVAEQHLELGDRLTNNWAEFQTLILALEALLHIVGDNASRTNVAVRGDSQLVINGVVGRWKIKHEALKPLRARAASLLQQFAATDVAWHRREHSVRALGH